jgi:ribosomal protein S18 acetylase RimI-like enzyme
METVRWRQHFLFNWLNFLYFQQKGYQNGFSIENSPIALFIVIPYVVFSEAYFLRQTRYFVTFAHEIVGVVAFQQRAESLYVSNLAVSPSHRRLGVATYAVNYAARVARKLRKDSLELSVNKRNLPALRLYMKSGFKLKEESRRSYVMRRNIHGTSP